MNRLTMKAATLAVALTLAAGCSKRAPDQLPPPPSDTSGGDISGGSDTGNVGGAVVPGTQAHFLQNVSSDRIYFALDDYGIDAEDRQTLDSQAAWLMQHPNARVTIEGHADERGTREYNLALGDRRANAAKNYLASRGVPADRMTVISYGKERPAALGSDESAWSQNRRAVTIIPQ